MKPLQDHEAFCLCEDEGGRPFSFLSEAGRKKTVYADTRGIHMVDADTVWYDPEQGDLFVMTRIA
jgi:hypothetical protein